MVPQFILISLLLGSLVSSHNILILFPTPSLSHQRPVMELTKALINRGHNLYVVSTDVIPGLEKNYTFVDMSWSYDTMSAEKSDQNEHLNLEQKVTKWELPEKNYRPYSEIAVKQFRSETFQQFLKQVEAEKLTFDLSIVEAFFTAHGCAMTRVLSNITGKHIPFITMSTISGIFCGEDEYGSIGHYSFTPSILSSYSDQMSVFEKIENWISHHYISGAMRGVMTDSARNYFTQTYGPAHGSSLVDGCWSNASLALLTSNFLYWYPRQLTPNVIELGPMHIETPGELPKNLQDWLDGAEKGVIYFSLGSNMKSIALPENVRENFLKFFRELPAGYRVLWKWEVDGKIPGQSDNILPQKWMPQQSILAHPKVRLFIMQGGLQSYQEAVNHGVPVVGIPWFGDQEANVAKIVRAEIGTRINTNELTSYEKIKTAIEAVLCDEKYSKNMKKLSAISKDFTAQTMDKAVFWVEHVARHGEALHLRPVTADATLFEFFCLDILTVILVVLLFVSYVIVSIFKFLMSALRSIGPSCKKKQH